MNGYLILAHLMQMFLETSHYYMKNPQRRKEDTVECLSRLNSAPHEPASSAEKLSTLTPPLGAAGHVLVQRLPPAISSPFCADQAGRGLSCAASPGSCAWLHMSILVWAAHGRFACEQQGWGGDDKLVQRAGSPDRAALSGALSQLLAPCPAGPQAGQSL